MRDQATEIDVRPCLTQAGRTTSADGVAVDRSGFESVTFALCVGSWTDGKHALTLKHSDDGVQFDAVPAEMVIGSAVVEGDGNSPEAATVEDACVTVGYTGGKKWIAPSVTVTGSPSTGAETGIVAIMGHAHMRPTQ